MATEQLKSGALLPAAIVLAIGAIAAAWVLGSQFRTIRGDQTISVKGLAQKSIRADQVEWTVGLRVQAATAAETLARLRAELPALHKFLADQGLSGDTLHETAATLEPNMEEERDAQGHWRNVQKGFYGVQDIVVMGKELEKVTSAYAAAVQFRAQEHPINYGAPLYLVSNLEEVKMSLIGAATRNARTRAEEFAKNGDVAVGAMRSASQGAFYILPPSANVDDSDWGGTYDKSTIDKVARVVVTIEYAIEP